MNSIYFNDLNSYDDLGLILKPRAIPTAEPNLIFIEVMGRDGALDMSEALTGEVTYKNFTIPFDFNVIDPVKDWDIKISNIKNKLHGQKMKITLSNDQNYYWLGRVRVLDFSSNKTLGSLSIECDVEPYKYKKGLTIVNQSVTAGDIINLTNDRKSVVPKITSDAVIKLKYNDKTFSISAGTIKILDIILKEGINTIEVLEGAGNLTFEYQEKSL